MKPRIISIIMLLMVIHLVDCTKQESGGVQIKGTVTFFSGDVYVNDKKVNVGLEVFKDDIFNTGKQSMAVIQFSEDAVITVKSETTLKISELSVAATGGNDVIGVTLDKGETFSKVMKKGTEYSVTTQTMVAAVRGTTFHVTNNGTLTRVDLMEGSLRVAKVPYDGRDMIIEEGQYITATKDGLSTPELIEKPEREKLNRYKGTFLKNNIISVIKMKDGTEYTGIFSQNGGTVEIILQDKKIKVPATDIKEITRYKE